MKNCAICLSMFYASLFSYTFIAITSSSCKSAANDVRPALDGWGETYYTPANTEVETDYRLSLKMCDIPPRNLTAEIWYFDLSYRAEDAIYSLTNPPYDDDGSQEDPELPNDTIDILVKTTIDGEAYSNYDKSGQTQLYLDPHELAIIRITDDKGNTTWLSTRTHNEQGSICIKL